MDHKALSRQLSQFEGMYLSGFFMMNPAIVTAMSLLFDKIYLPNQLEIAISIAKKYRIRTKDDDIPIRFDNQDNTNGADPLVGLPEIEQKTVRAYLYMAYMFCVEYYELFPEVFQTDLFEDNRIFNVELLKKGKNGLNEYNVSFNSMTVCLDGYYNVEQRLKHGCVPLIGLGELTPDTINTKQFTSAGVAALIAMQSIEMLFPATKKASSQTILEARERLKDFLPTFWSAMLKFSKDGEKIIKQAPTIEDATHACRDIIDSTIRPILIDMNNKIIKERRNWFYKIISPVGKTMKLIVGKPQMTNLDLLTTSVSLAADVGFDYVKHKQKLNELKEETGLVYLLELGKVLK